VLLAGLLGKTKESNNLMTLSLQMKEPPNQFSWGASNTSIAFNVGPPSDLHPFGYEPEIINCMEHFAETGDVVVDAGASIGFHTCFLSKLVGEGGIVLAFEPQLVSFQALMHHVHISNKLHNVACFRQALWHEDRDDLKLWNFSEMGYSTFHPYFNTVNYEIVEGRKLDTLLIDAKDHPRILKIDCEGAEVEVLLGAQRHLTRGIDCVILELNYQLMQKLDRTDRQLRHLMHSLGYEMFLINIGVGDNGNGKYLGYAPPIAVSDPDQPIELRGGFHINVLFSTKEKVRERWKTNGI
jgi:FkbM family methyltransferase